MIVTGALSGIGRAIAGLFADEGADVTLVDVRENSRDDDRLGVEVAATLGSDARFVRADVTNGADVIAAFDAAGNPDVVVNNAGVTAFKPIGDLSEADYDLVMDVNVRGVFLMSQHAVLQWSEAESSGVIVNVASNFAFVGSADATVYCASKGAVVSFTKALAAEVAHQGIRVNALCPGATATEFNREFRAKPGVLSQWEKETPLRLDGQRFLATPAEIAPAALFLASDDLRFMTGAALVIDGGWNSH